MAANVTYIPPKAAKPEALRVAAYCRVSSDSSDQLHSYATQIKAYTEQIGAHTDWELVDVYADEGLTGTRMDKREDFQRLLADCRKGKVDRVLCKSISRFARNTKDCLAALRELSALGVTAPQIESVLRGDSASMDERVRAVIHAQADKYVRGLLSAITESGLDVRAMPTVFLGGGAALMKRHGGAVEGLFRPFILDDVCLNAKGYERLVAQMSRGERRERDG